MVKHLRLLLQNFFYERQDNTYISALLRRPNIYIYIYPYVLPATAQFTFQCALLHSSTLHIQIHNGFILRTTFPEKENNIKIICFPEF
jgi:hypothetical protein